MSDRSAIVLRRSKVYRDRLRKYKVRVDDQEIGTIAAGEDKRFVLVPGQHQLKLKVDMYSSPPYTFNLAPGETIEFSCGGGKTWRSIIDLFRPNNWITLERDDT